MHLNAREAARLLRVPERTIHRWLQSGELPSHRIQDQYRMNRVELLEWAARQGMAVAPEAFYEPREPVWSLAEALQRGGVIAIGGDRRAAAAREGEGDNEEAAVLRAVAAAIPLPRGVDRDMLTAALATGRTRTVSPIGGGVAVPHVRYPLVLDLAEPQVTLCRLAQPLTAGAPDGRPIGMLFVVLSPTIRAHLQLLARLMFALQDRDVRAALERHADPGEVIAALRQLEQRAPAPPAARESHA